MPFSTSDKVSYRQHTEDLEVLERKLSKRIDEKVVTFIQHLSFATSRQFPILTPGCYNGCTVGLVKPFFDTIIV